MASARFCVQFAKKLLSWNCFIESKQCMSTQTSASTLAKLRKMTGYSMSNCKKALTMHSDDLEKAKAWLHEEARKQGWSKIANLENRPAAQGLVAVFCKDSVGAMVEVNCETDFVSRNAEFQGFVANVLSSCINYSLDNSEREECHKLHLDAESLSKLPFGSSTLGDLNASAVGKFREKTVLRRAVCFRTGNDILLSSFSHPCMPCADLAQGTFGKYGGLIAYRTTQVLPGVTHEALLEHGHNLCQHIVGMNPSAIGDVEHALKSSKDKSERIIKVKEVEAEDRKDDIVVKDSKSEEEETEDEESDQEQEDDNAKLVDSNESRLVFQQFLVDPTINVAEYLVKNSLEVLDFQRFECGEVDSN